MSIGMKYREIAEAVAVEGFREGEIIPSELSYAQRFGVNRATARQAMTYLERRGVVSPLEGRKRRFLKPLETAKAPLTIGCVGYGDQRENAYQNLVVARIFDTLSQALQQDNILLVKAVTRPSDTELPAILRALPMVGSFCMGPLNKTARAKLPRPTFAFDYYYDFTDIYSVCQAGEAVAIDAVTHLFNLGHRQIGFVPGSAKNYPFFDALKTGYRQAVTALGLPPPPRDLFAEDLWERQEVAIYLKALLEVFPNLDALVASSSDIAFPALQALRDMGKRVPEDISLLAIGGTLDLDICLPPLTAYENDYARLATITRELVLNVLAGRVTHPGNYRVNAMRLVQRQSVAKRET